MHAQASPTASPRDVTERAQAAVKAFRQMQHGLTAYARAITGDQEVRVEVSDGPPRTNGKIIHYRPPIALGDRTPHDRNFCDERSPSGLKACMACRIREEVLVNIYHEIAHIAFNSFDGNNYMGQAARYNEFLPFLFNCLEDSRVDSAMFSARNGTRKMLQADTFNLLREGVPDAQGNRHKSSEAPLNGQVSLACYLEAAGYEGWDSLLHPQVARDIQDPKVQQHLKQVSKAATASDVYRLSSPVLHRLRELGYFKSEQEQEEEKQADEQPKEEQDPKDGDEAGSSDGDPDDSSEPEGDADASDPEPDGQGDDGTDDSRGDAGDAPGEEPDDASADQGEAGDEGSGDDGDQDEGAPGEDGDGDQGDIEGGEGGGDAGDGSPTEPEGDSSDGEGVPSSDGSESSDTGSGEGGSDPQEGAADNPGSGSEEGGEVGADHDGVPNGDDRSGAGHHGDRSEPPAEPGAESDGNDKPADGSDGPVESGADKGEGGIETEGVGENEAIPVPRQGGVEDVATALTHGHQVSNEHHEKEDSDDEKIAIAIAVIQGLYFETPSYGVSNVEEHNYGPTVRGWDSRRFDSSDLKDYGILCDMDIPENVLGPALLKTRRIFSDNKTSAYQTNLRSGRVNAKVLGRRAWGDDDRLFGKKRIPGKQDYAVQIMLDISSSNLGDNLALVKRAVKAQAELCHRVGIKFSIVAHSASAQRSKGEVGFTMHLHHIKAWDEPWTKEVQERLATLVGVGGNLDGHAMEYGRKQLAKVEATDKIFLYYTDGKMPAANHDEEQTVLENQIRLSKRDRITLLGVGIRTDSPIRHGLDTVQVDTDDDLKKVVEHLGKRLVKTGR